MKLIRLERHRYAPELNTAVFDHKGTEHNFRVPGVVHMSDVRRVLFGFKRGFFATVAKTYADRPNLNRTVTGFVSSRVEAVALARDWVARLAPGGVVTVKTVLRG